MNKQLIALLTIILMTATTQVVAWTKTKKLTYDSLLDLDLGKSKKEVIKLIGKPNLKRGCQVDKLGRSIEVFEYHLEIEKTIGQIICGIVLVILTLGLFLPLLFIPNPVDVYWLYFCEDKLIQWGRAGDWKPIVMLFMISTLVDAKG